MSQLNHVSFCIWQKRSHVRACYVSTGERERDGGITSGNASKYCLFVWGIHLASTTCLWFMSDICGGSDHTFQLSVMQEPFRCVILSLLSFFSDWLEQETENETNKGFQKVSLSQSGQVSGWKPIRSNHSSPPIFVLVWLSSVWIDSVWIGIRLACGALSSVWICLPVFLCELEREGVHRQSWSADGTEFNYGHFITRLSSWRSLYSVALFVWAYNVRYWL